MIEELIKRLRERTSNTHMLLVDPPRPAPDDDCRQAADIIETQAAEIKRLREALRGMVEYSRFNESWQEAHPEYVAAARAALGETE